MNKITWDAFKVIIDEYVAREKMLTDLLKEKEDTIRSLTKELDEIYK